jgi:hypothetical protein
LQKNRAQIAGLLRNLNQQKSLIESQRPNRINAEHLIEGILVFSLKHLTKINAPGRAKQPTPRAGLCVGNLGCGVYRGLVIQEKTKQPLIFGSFYQEKEQGDTNGSRLIKAKSPLCFVRELN